MKWFRLSTYNFYCERATSELKIVDISDLHFSRFFREARLQRLLEFVAKQRPDYIFIVGDLVESCDSLDLPSERERLRLWLKQLGAVAPVLVGLGNHDFYRKRKLARVEKSAQPATQRRKPRWVMEAEQGFFAEINQLENVHVLNNSVYEDERIFVLGLTLSARYYGLNPTLASQTRRAQAETPEALLQDLRALPQKWQQNLPKLKLKFALIHSPINLHHPEVQAALSAYDYLVAGHVHNGLVLPVLDELWGWSSRGLMNPRGEIFPKNIRNTIRRRGDKVIISGAITTCHPASRLMRCLNALFPMYVNLLRFSHQRQYAKRPQVKVRYLRG